MHFLWTLIVGAVIGSIGGAIAGEKRGCIFDISRIVLFGA